MLYHYKISQQDFDHIHHRLCLLGTRFFTVLKRLNIMKKATAVSNQNFSGTATLFIKKNVVVRNGARLVRAIVVAIKKKNTYVEIICALLIILFIYTGLNKIMGLEKFRYEMGRSPFIEHMSGFISYSLPPGELLLSLLLIIKRTRLLGLHLSFALMALFTGYIWLMLNYAADLPCSCGGIVSQLTWHDHLIFNSVFTALSAIGVLLQGSVQSLNKRKMTSPT